MQNPIGIDIGNSQIKIVHFKKWNILKIPLNGFYEEDLRRALEKFSPTDAVVSSVVPSITRVTLKFLKDRHISPIVVNHETSDGLIILYRSRIGSDRIANAVAGYHLTGNGVMVVDLGTATTTTIVNKQKELVGGSILPGLDTMVYSLSERTAQLPLVKLTKPESTFGSDTKSSIITGVVLGTAGAVERLYKEATRKFGNLALIITGGYATLLKDFLSIDAQYEPELTLKGLKIIYERYRR